LSQELVLALANQPFWKNVPTFLQNSKNICTYTHSLQFPAEMSIAVKHQQLLILF